jgi:ethanolamine utilization protein EutN
MQLAIIKGRATSTIKHDSLVGRKLLIAQILGNEGQPVADPVLVLDDHGAGAGDHVIITSDGKGLRSLLDRGDSPARWWTLGIVD